MLFALHDNYIDFYPDAEGFSYEQNIAFHANGTPVRAWLNEGRKAQSYRYRADRIEPFLQANLRALRDKLPPDGLLHRRLVEHRAVRLLDRRRPVLRPRATRATSGAGSSPGSATCWATTPRRSPKAATTS